MSMPRPNFFILGAPKCGTTSLANWLAEHPAVFMPRIKEPHYFCTDLSNRTVTEWSAYQALFRQAGPGHAAIGEASTWYLYSDVAVRAIEKACPSSRHIVMVRDPIEMVRSLHLHNLRHLHESEPDLNVAWGLQGVRRLGRRLPPGCREPRYLQYKDAASFGARIERLLAEVPPERVLVLTLEELRRDPCGAYAAVLRFLGLADDRRTSFPPENEARAPKNVLMQRLLLAGGRLKAKIGIRRSFGVLRLNEAPAPKARVSPAVLCDMQEAFASDQRLLEHVLLGVCRPVVNQQAAHG